MTPFSHFPMEILEQILQVLSFDDLCRWRITHPHHEVLMRRYVDSLITRKIDYTADQWKIIVAEGFRRGDKDMITRLAYRWRHHRGYISAMIHMVNKFPDLEMMIGYGPNDVTITVADLQWNHNISNTDASFTVTIWVLFEQYAKYRNIDSWAYCTKYMVTAAIGAIACSLITNEMLARLNYLFELFPEFLPYVALYIRQAMVVYHDDMSNPTDAYKTLMKTLNLHTPDYEKMAHCVPIWWGNAINGLQMSYRQINIM